MNTTMQPHIRCSKENAAKYALLPGDPQRIDRIKKFLDSTEEVAYNREFRTISGFYKGIKILVTSTGIGGASTGIAVEELKNIGVDTLVRIGSCGALQDNIKLGDLVIGTGAVRNDGASRSYVEESYPAVPDIQLLMCLANSAAELNYDFHCGIIRSHDSFYTDEEENIDKLWATRNVLVADMESAALMVIGSLRGLKTASILNVVVDSKGNLESGINEYVNGEEASLKGEEREILTALEAIFKLSLLKSK